MQISKRLINFINDYENKELLNNFKFKELYEKLNKHGNDEHIGQFTALMYEAKIDPLLYLDEVPECFLFGNTDVKNVDIPSNITSISEYAFYNCRSITSVTIPGNVKSIGKLAFADCSSLTSVVISNGVTSIGNQAFSDCSSLTSIIIPDSVTEIGYFVFSRCYELTSITIPCSVDFIEVSAFTGCKALKSINYLGTKKQWRNLLNGKRLVGFPRGCIIHCTDGDIKL